MVPLHNAPDNMSLTCGSQAETVSCSAKNKLYQLLNGRGLIGRHPTHCCQVFFSVLSLACNHDGMCCSLLGILSMSQLVLATWLFVLSSQLKINCRSYERLVYYDFETHFQLNVCWIFEIEVLKFTQSKCTQKVYIADQRSSLCRRHQTTGKSTKILLIQTRNKILGKPFQSADQPTGRLANRKQIYFQALPLIRSHTYTWTSFSSVVQATACYIVTA